jgi:2-dehydro-3-deoxyphosphogluconate aldolase / (4S)-4-hydroxy-2-oxoglutarate aldolase
VSEDRVLEALAESRVLPVVAIDDAEVVAELCAALQRGGIHCAEITFRTDAAADALARAAQIPGMLVGAGTVLTAEQARLGSDACAAFAVAPGTDDEVIDACAELALPFFPGVATPTELGHALRRGRTTVKVFPASTVGGPAFLRAVSATYPHARFIPTGGIDAASLASYLAVPSVLACGGSWLSERAVLAARDWDEVTRRAREAVEAAA